MDVLANIKELLKLRGKLQSDLCRHLGLRNQTFSDWKAGRSKSYIRYIPEIAKYLEVSPNEIYGEETTDVEELVVTEESKALEKSDKNKVVIINQNGKYYVPIMDLLELDLLRFYRGASHEAKALLRDYLVKSAEPNMTTELSTNAN